jgi:hypothetical protein
MQKIFQSRNFSKAKITFGLSIPECNIDDRGNPISEKTVITLYAQVDRFGSGSGVKGDTEAIATDERIVEGHLVDPARLPKILPSGVIGRIEYEDGEINTCRLLPVSQLSWRVVKCDRLKLAVGAGSIVRLT